MTGDPRPGGHQEAGSSHREQNRVHEHLVTERAGGVEVLRVDRPAALGALSRGMLLALREHLTDLHADESVRVLIVTGTGKGFIAGADIREYHGVSQRDFDAYQRLSRAVFDALAALPQVTIAAVNGYALGGGFEVALSCDLIVASDRARFGLPEINLGLLPGGGGTQRLARAAGVRFATEAVLTGRFYPARKLHDRGVVNEVHSPDELLPRTRELAATIAAKAPVAVRAAKRLVADGARMPLDVGLTVEQQVLSGLYATADAAEGVAAFLDKRQPTFTGR
ncbi:enoyl-CoA hydratase/isomerase family protein [Plantactinospora sp. GCM10030261]|uniref:enoyl-CoA hydratase/isomerase family protein n=1 Tax=Plantactinospora sp. GCM10030261 TaxID=3273420 RepID=UPI00360BF28C